MLTLNSGGGVIIVIGIQRVCCAFVLAGDTVDEQTVKCDPGSRVL